LKYLDHNFKLSDSKAIPEPTAEDKYKVDVTSNGNIVHLEILDTSGVPFYDTLHQRVCLKSHDFLCFIVIVIVILFIYLLLFFFFLMNFFLLLKKSSGGNGPMLVYLYSI